MGTMKINYNATAMVTNNALKRNDTNLSESTKKLSSGYKINNAKDNPSGLAMAKRMNLQLKGLEVGKYNSNEGISIVRVADGALSEITEMLQRMNELAIKGANGTMSDSDRSTLEDEVKQLKEEIARIGSETQFNGQHILDGSFDLKGYNMNENIGVKVLSYSDETLAGEYAVKDLVVEIDADSGDISKCQGLEIHKVGDLKYDALGNLLYEDAVGNVVAAGTPGAKPATYKQEVKEYGLKVNVERTLKGSTKKESVTMDVENVQGDVVTLRAADGTQFQLKITEDTALDTSQTGSELTLNLIGIGAMRMQVGANEGQVIELRIPCVSLEHMQIDKLTLATKQDCLDAIDSVSNAIQYISATRSRLGAYENRLEHKINSLDTTYENMTSAYSTIMDVDMAEEMTNYTTQQVLSQSSMAILAQANERPSQVLQLLQ